MRAKLERVLALGTTLASLFTLALGGGASLRGW
jgi:hypothetical protein